MYIYIYICIHLWVPLVLGVAVTAALLQGAQLSDALRQIGEVHAFAEVEPRGAAGEDAATGRGVSVMADRLARRKPGAACHVQERHKP